MKRILTLAAGAIALAACSDSAPLAPESDLALNAAASHSSNGSNRTATVRNSNDDGPGSFRYAIEQANANPAIRTISFSKRLDPIQLQSTVVFSGAQDLEINGDNAEIDAAGTGGTGFLANGGGDMDIRKLTVRNAPQEGITVEVPSDATGTITVTLDGVQIIDNLGHGVLVNDQVEPVVDGDNPPVPDGSDASVHVIVRDSRFSNNGYSVSDRDGLRVNEGGLGDLTFDAKGVVADENAADGIELDERGTGDIRLDVRDLRILRNGPLDPADLDDGFDIDENNEGSILGRVINSAAIDNQEEGFDFNENNEGDLRVDFLNVVATGNGEEGIDLEEDDDFAGGGDLVTTLIGIEANNNGGDGGLKIREKGDGDLSADVTRVIANDNVASGISVREDADGNLTSRIVLSQTTGNGEHGIDFDENSTGDLIARIISGNTANNAEFGIRADQGGAGVGTLDLFSVRFFGNGDGEIDDGNVVVTRRP